MITGSGVVNAFTWRTSAGVLAPRLSYDLLIRGSSQTFSSCQWCWSVRGAAVHTRRAVCYSVPSSS